MPALHIRNVDDAIIDALKRRAAANNRSLEAELREILYRVAFGSEREDSDRGRPRLRIKTVAIPSDAKYGRGEIYDDDGR
jgi:plasmid stability protein